MSEPSQVTNPTPTEKKGLGLTTQILIALVLGVVLGVVYPQVALSLRFVGDIFMAALKMLIMPLILVTMIVGVASLGSPQELGRLGWRAIFYYFTTTALAIVVGMIAVNWMQPGALKLPDSLVPILHREVRGVHSTQKDLNPAARIAIAQAFSAHLLHDAGKNKAEQQTRAAALADQAVNTLSRTIQQSLREGVTKADGAGKPMALAISVETLIQRAEGAMRAELVIARVGMRRSLQAAEEMRAGSQAKGPPLTVSRFLHMQIDKMLQNPFEALASGNVLGIILFSILFGLILVSLGARGQPVLTLADSLNQAMMRFVEWVMVLTPYGVFSLMAYQVAQSGLDILVLLGKYMICVVIALIIHGAIVLPLVLWIFGRRSPLAFFLQVRDALGVAFSTSSSSATLPVSLEVVEQKAKIQPKVAGFVLPLGATVNMDGTALYEAIAALFIAQIYGIDLGVGPQILIFLTAALAAIGAAGIPSAGTVTMVMVLTAVGLPLTGIGLILAVDRILDMCRTTVNVWGDLVGAAILDRWENQHENASR